MNMLNVKTIPGVYNSNGFWISVNQYRVMVERWHPGSTEEGKLELFPQSLRDLLEVSGVIWCIRSTTPYHHILVIYL